MRSILNWLIESKPSLEVHVEIVLGSAAELRPGAVAIVDSSCPETIVRMVKLSHRRMTWLVTGFEEAPWSKSERRMFIRRLHFSRNVFWSAKVRIPDSRIALNIAPNDG